jgi:NadR type nicotinamide-nucleotide adenylyltransferase
VPECVRPALARRVVVAGPESTGKTTLARDLATHFGTAWAPEFARGYLERKYSRQPPRSPPCEPDDIPAIARGQLAAEDEAARRSSGVLLCDTDLYATRFYAEEYFGSCPDWIRATADERRYDLHLLLDADVPWVADPQRDLPHRRRHMLVWLRAAFEAAGRPYVLVSGSWEDRRHRAIDAVGAVLGTERRDAGLASR